MKTRQSAVPCKNFLQNSLINANIKEAYFLEKALADRLKKASNEERKKLYNIVYAEYYDTFPSHPFIDRNEDLIRLSTALQFQYLKSFLKHERVFLEIGPGTGHLSIEVSKYVKTVYVLDVSDKPLKETELPSNIKRMLYNGINIPECVKPVDIIYSNHVMEHLHPEDALEQLKNIYSILANGGIYICRTPHRYSGPHDISKYFDQVSTCFHLKEYTGSELIDLFKIAGFKNIKYEITPKGVKLAIPLSIIKVIEIFLKNFSFNLRKSLANKLPLRPLLNFYISGVK